MNYLLLARDLLERRKPLEYPCTFLSVVCNKKEEVQEELSKWLLLTYRTGFAPLPRSSVTSDKGWGCLIRTVQMMLARCIRMHCPADVVDDVTIRSWFRDIDDPSAPFSIHHLVRAVLTGNNCFEPEFWAPSLGCEAVRGAVAFAVARKLFRPSLNVFVAQGASIPNPDVVFRLDEMGPMLLLVPVRVGVRNCINQLAYQSIQYLLRAPGALGVVGGVPRRSYFIVGTTGQRLVYLDPHILTQPAFTSEDKIGQFHEVADDVQTVAWNRIDTSLLFGFYVTKQEQWKQLSDYIMGQSAHGDMLFMVDQPRQHDARGHAGGGSLAHVKDHGILTWDSDDD
jgi:cysteine protease ATG4